MWLVLTEIVPGGDEGLRKIRVNANLLNYYYTQDPVRPESGERTRLHFNGDTVEVKETASQVDEMISKAMSASGQ